MTAYKAILAALILVFTLNIAGASITAGNLSSSITTSYSSGDKLAGWINISLSEVDASSLISGLSQGAVLADFLEANSADYTCSPANCLHGYSSSGEEDS